MHPIRRVAGNFSQDLRFSVRSVAADPASLAGSVATLAAVTVLSGAFLAYRAAHPDPVESLRSE